MKSKLDYISERILVKRLIDNIELLSKANSHPQMTAINNDIAQDLYRYQLHCFLKLEEKDGNNISETNQSSNQGN